MRHVWYPVSVMLRSHWGEGPIATLAASRDEFGADGRIRTSPSLFVEDNRLLAVTYATKFANDVSVRSTTLRRR